MKIKKLLKLIDPETVIEVIDGYSCKVLYIGTSPVLFNNDIDYESEKVAGISTTIDGTLEIYLK